jgi:hypothetical protein
MHGLCHAGLLFMHLPLWVIVCTVHCQCPGETDLTDGLVTFASSSLSLAATKEGQEEEAGGDRSRE